MKTLLILPLSILLCLLLLSCNTDSTDDATDEDAMRTDTTNMLRESGELHSGGQLDFDMNGDGSFSYSYVNPDGSTGAGGGAILD